MRKLPRDERAFWRKLRSIVVAELNCRCIPESWITSEEVPDSFIEFMLSIFTDAFDTEEECYDAWCHAILSVAEALVGEKASSIEIRVTYDYPSPDAIPEVIVAKGNSFRSFRFSPGDVFETDYETLRDFIRSVAAHLENAISALEEVS